MSQFSKPNRRQFLTQTVAGAFAIGACHAGWAADPVQRNSKPYMKLSLAAYSFNRLLPRNWPTPRDGNPTMSLMDFIDYCAEQNLDGTELTSYYFPKDVTNDYLMSIKEKTFRLGLDISGTAIGNDFCLAPGEARDAQLAMTRQWIDYAATMGAPVIRIFAGQVPQGGDAETAFELCIAGIDESVAYAAQKGVVLALENHGGITATPEQLLSIVKRVKPSPWFGVNFDSGNFRTADPYADLEKIAPYAVNAQIKVAVNPNNGGKEPSDLKRMVEILKQHDYRGYVVLEYEEEDPYVEIPKYLDQLRSLIV